MPIFDELITGCWLVFVAYWLVSAIGVKKAVKRGWGWRGVGFRIALAVLLLLLLRRPLLSHRLGYLGKHLAASPDPVIGSIGIAVCLAGLAFAIWARVELGRNWGMPMSLKEGHELITAGPYAYVRHPIYGGILLAMLGSALAEGMAWLVPFAVAGVYFLYSAKTEERLMRAQFPSQYPDYVRKTKMLIPFVF